MNWLVYIIQCSDDSLYTGITTDMNRRLTEHKGSTLGAKYFNGRAPKRVVYTENGHTRSSASQREAAIKKLNRKQKLALVADATPTDA